jgi:hypothetical protein
MRVIDILQEFAPPGQQSDPVQDKADIMTLLGFKPSKEALSVVQQILAEPEVEPTNQSSIQKTPIAQPQPQQDTTPQATQQSTLPVEQPVPNEEPEEELYEDGVIDLLVEKIKKLDPNNPKDADKITKIESILEDDVIEPAITKVVAKKFNSFVDLIVNDIKHALMAASNPIIEKIKFLVRVDKGLVDLKAIFASQTVGNVYHVVNDPVFDNIKYRLGRIEYGVGGSKLGKMETLLTFIDKNASKQGHGDLNFADGTEVEIKASSDKKGGGVSGAKMIALGKDKTTGESAYGSNIEAGKYWAANMTPIIPIKYLPMSLTDGSIRKQINPYIEGKPKLIKHTVDVIKDVYKKIFVNASPKMFSVLDDIANKEGINPEKLIRASRQIEFDYYKKLINHDAILFINADSGNYTYVESGKNLAKSISTTGRGSNFYTTGIIDFQGSYGNGLSAVFIK